jgi:hypothetical protein
MPTLTELTAQLDQLRKARASGVRSTAHGDTRTEYKTDAEMAAAEANLQRQIAAAGGNPVRTIYISGSRGL